MSTEVMHFTTDEYAKALTLGPAEGFACHSLAELCAFVTGLLNWDGLAGALGIPDSAKAALKGPGAWWFRGVHWDHPLLSGIHRWDPTKLDYSRTVADHDDLDRRLRHEYFQHVRRQYHELTTSNVWDLLFEMQHYRVPTRLLDWTLSLTTATFFATHEILKEREEDRRPTIWILNPRILSGVCLGEYALNDYPYLEMHGTPAEVAAWKKFPHLKRSTRFGRPNWIYRELVETSGHYPLNASWTNARLIAQMGMFTLQAGPEALDALAQRPGQPKFLLKVRLETDTRGLARAWHELQCIGVDERYLFPERENLSNSIKANRRFVRAEEASP